MRTQIVILALAIFGGASAQYGCGNPYPPPAPVCLPPAPVCLPPAPVCLPAPSCLPSPAISLPSPSPYEALGAALAVPSPVPPTPYLPAYAPTGPVLPGCGPAPSPLPVQQAPPVTIPGPCSPIVNLPAPCLPPPQVIGHRCVVSKTVLKPQVYQRLIHVPTTARFLKKSVGNVVENIAYSATPQCGQESPVCAPAPPCGCAY